MKKNLLIIILLLVVVLIYSADFRNTSWGMTKSEVKAVETAKPKPVNDTNILGYIAQVNNVTMEINYYFTPITGKLYQASYATFNNYKNGDDCYNDYKSFRSILVKNYGEPYEDSDTDHNPDDVFVIAGIYCKFKTSATDILLKISTDDEGYVFVWILYQSFKLKDLAEKKKINN